MTQRFGFSAARSVHSFIRDNCDRVFITTTAPASYSAASNQPQMVVSANVTSDEWTISSGAQGPALVFNSRTLTIEGSGSASHMVWARSSGSTILAVTDVCAGTTLSSGNSVTMPVWRAEIVAGDTFHIARPEMVPLGLGVDLGQNLLKNPNNLAGATWGNANGMLAATASAAPAPSGIFPTSAAKLNENGNVSTHLWAGGTSAAANILYRMELYGARGDSIADCVQIYLDGDSNAAATFMISASATFQPVKGSKCVSADQVSVATNWYRMRAWVSCSAGDHGFRIAMQTTAGVGAGAHTYDGTGGQGNYFTGAFFGMDSNQ
jgi:hypothetical protein